MSKQAKSNYEGQERESLRLGHEAATRETVQPVVENKSAHDAARKDRFEKTGEPATAPRCGDVRE